MLPDLESLRCFVAAATQPSFRAAARSVALSPAAFGDRIQRLEEALGGKLFQRTTRKLALSACGERLLPQARRCLDEAERCRVVVQSDAREPFDLVIGTRFELGMSWIVPSLAELERACPARRLHVYFGDTQDLLPRVQQGELHCMVTSARLAVPGLEFARLHEEEYVFVGSRRSIEQRPLARPADAKHHVLLDVHADLPLFRYFIDARPAEELWLFRRVQRLGGIAAVRARVLEGAGVAVLPLYYVRRDIQARRLKRVLSSTRLPSDWFRLVWRQGHARDAELRDLAAELARLPLR